jgi:gliding-associated putative ABC transporter substrate-binding component GldG
MKKENLFKFKQGVGSVISVLTILGILVVVNFLVYQVFVRIDLSRGKIYSLSKATKKMISNLDDPVIIKAFFSRNLPAPYNSNRQYIKDLLSEYKTYSKGNIKIQFIDPSEDEKIRLEAQMTGIAPVRITQVESDKYEMKEAYMGLVFLYEDKKEIIPFINQTGTLEYDVTSRIKKITQSSIKSLGFLSGNSETDIFKELPQIGQFLSEQYTLKNISFKEDKKNPHIDALVILLPKEKLSDWEKYKIDQLLMKGKPVAFLLGRTDVDLQSFRAKAIDDGLDDLLKHYGVEIRPGLVLDPQCQMVTLQTKRGLFTVNNMVKYLFFPLVTSFKKDNLIVKGLERVTFPFINPIKAKDSSSEKGKDTEKKDLEIEILAQSSEKSWYKENPGDLNPLRQYLPSPEDETGPFDLAVIIKGSFESFYAGKEILPVPWGDDSDNKEEFIKQSIPTRLLVIGNARFVNMGDQAGVNFFLNIVDWLAQDEALISIRSKEIVYRPLKDISKGWRRVIKYIDIFFVPLMLVLFGLILWRIRRFLRVNLTLENLG